MWDRRKQLVPSLKCFKSVTMPKTECSENAAAWVIRKSSLFSWVAHCFTVRCSFGSTKPSTYRSWKTDGAWQRHWCHKAPLVFRENWSCYEKAYGQEASKQSWYAAPLPLCLQPVLPTRVIVTHDPSLTHIWPQPQPAQHKCLLCSNAELLICWPN